jgi:hypothetical protein
MNSQSPLNTDSTPDSKELVHIPVFPFLIFESYLMSAYLAHSTCKNEERNYDTTMQLTNNGMFFKMP